QWAGSQCTQNMDGKDFGPLAEGRDDRPLWEEIVCCENTWQSKWALRTETHKLILSRRPDPYASPSRELYDLRSDPEELSHLSNELPELADGMERRLEEWIAAGLARWGRTDDPVVAQGIALGKRWEPGE